MQVRSLRILLGEVLVGHLFRVDRPACEPTLRFVADADFARLADPPTLSVAFLDAPQAQAAVWADYANPLFNGRASQRYGWLLPAFFQNLLPEGVFRDQLAQLRGCAATDHFEMLAALGRDLPGALRAEPAQLSPTQAARLLLAEREVIDIEPMLTPMDDGVSISGIQPKLGVLREGERYVARTRHQETQVIAKLPVVGYPCLPEVEELSLRLAKVAGVDVCTADLAPLAALAVAHHYDLGEADSRTAFLAVQRFDRSPSGRIHCEDFAQAFGVQPEEKYTLSYELVARLMMSLPSLGEPAVHELLRRLLVNELLGNPDMHLKNIGLRYLDGRTPMLSPAYDIVAYAAFNARGGHALHLLQHNPLAPKPRIRAPQAGDPLHGKAQLSPALLRAFCEAVGIPEKPAQKVLRDTMARVLANWPAMIEAAAITPTQKERLLRHLTTHEKYLSAQRAAHLRRAE